MNRRRFLAFIFVLLVAAGLWGLLHKKPESPAPPPTPVEAQNQPQQPQGAPTIPQSAAPPVASTPKARHHVAAASTEPQVSGEVMRYSQNVQADPQYDWKQPINFYGKVVDETNQPVANASIHFVWNDLSQKGTSETNAQSDADGLFSFTGQQGKRLFVDVAKDGYYSSRQNPLAFEYANPADGLFTPDADKPVIFHLRKKGQAEQLIHGLKLFGSRVDGTLSYVDLTTAKNGRTPPGDLTVQCTRSEPNAEKKFDWTFTLGASDGGLIESTNEFDFIAPEGGYQSSYQITHRASDPDWTGQEKRKFFVKSMGGQHYARIEITIMPDYNQNAAYDVEWFLNPSGSRNLEYDSNTAVQPGQ
jgi:hypothetical protein